MLSEEAATGPASAVYVVEGGDPAKIATWFQQALETATYSTDSLSGPMEDGGYVLESSGEDPACRLSVTIAPLGGTIVAHRPVWRRLPARLTSLVLGDNACEGVVCWPPTDAGFGPGAWGRHTCRQPDRGISGPWCSSWVCS